MRQIIIAAFLLFQTIYLLGVKTVSVSIEDSTGGKALDDIAKKVCGMMHLSNGRYRGYEYVMKLALSNFEKTEDLNKKRHQAIIFFYASNQVRPKEESSKQNIKELKKKMVKKMRPYFYRRDTPPSKKAKVIVIPLDDQVKPLEDDEIVTWEGDTK
jgi:hypothetical protein